MGVLVTLSDLKRRFNNDMDEARADGEVVGPCKKAWHLFEWTQSFTVFVLYLVTAIVLINNWLVTQEIQFRSGIGLNIGYADNEEGLAKEMNITDYKFDPCNRLTIKDCLKVHYNNTSANNQQYEKDCLIYEKNATVGPSGNKIYPKIYETNCRCKEENYKNMCRLMFNKVFTFNITRIYCSKTDGIDDDGLQLYLKAKAGYQHHIDEKNDNACFGQQFEYDEQILLPFAIACSIVMLTCFALLLAVLECSGTFVPEDHKLHQVELQLKKAIRYYLIEFKDQKGRQTCWVHRSKKKQEVFLSFMQYIYTTMTYNCMLGAFTKPGLNLMGNDDLIFDSDDDYNGPALWKTSTYSFIVYFMMGCYAFFSFLVLFFLPCGILKSIKEKKLSVAINAPIGPFLFIIGNILGFILVMNVCISYGIAISSMTVPTIHISDLLFGISLDWTSFKFRVPEAQFPIALSIFTIGALKLSLIFSRAFVKCKLKDARKVAAAMEEDAMVNQDGKDMLQNPNEEEGGGTWKDAATDIAKEKMEETAREKAMETFDKKYNSIMGKPIFLLGINGNYLQNQDPIPQCTNKNKADWESMMLEKIDEKNDKYVLTSNRTGCRLQCTSDGTALFANKNKGAWEELKVEKKDDNKYFFISCHTSNVLQCNPKNGAIRFENKNRGAWETFELH